MFKVGDVVFHAKCGMTEKWIQCPDCFGTEKLKVILGDGTELLLDCMGCAPGMQSPMGVIKSYQWAADVEKRVITGMTLNGDKVEYHSHVTDCCWNTLKPEDTFATIEEAAVRAKELEAIHTQEEAERLLRKERDTKSWAWHVSYYRGKIRRAKQDIEYAEKRLGIAQQKAKM